MVKIGNKSIFDTGDILDSTFYARPGTFVEYLVMRNGKELTIPVRVAPRPSQAKELDSAESSTAEVNDINSSLKTNSITGPLDHD